MNIEKIVKRSYKDYHVTGLNSIVLDAEHDNLIRMFYTEPNHLLWKNKNILSENLTMPFFSYCSNVKINVIRGKVTYITATVEQEKDYGNIKSWKFENKNSKNNFKFINDYTLMNVKRYHFSQMSSYMGIYANELYNIYVEPGEIAVWIIFGEKKYSNYNNIYFSNNDLSKFKFENFYKPISKEEVEKAIKWW